ncbi:carbohydrate esterase family 4 protein [Amanita thiersii Skay4041]|uniref:Carbohydrate esterase family 4 protein n=1 Tax=Amanita thiersii Skay4041 TaxID=703135 RepID=A0A2A9NKV1_9AGAR|nr:carbohydrate esterase family 4 protein [Amanita thiersii Skay4041]
MLVLLVLVASAVISSALSAEGTLVGKVITSCAVRGTAALTFIADTLKENHAIGTFFFTDCIYKQREYVESHPTRGVHPDLATLAADSGGFWLAVRCLKLTLSLLQGEASKFDLQVDVSTKANTDEIKRITGAVLAPWAAFKRYNDLVLQEAHKLGLLVTLWNVELSLFPKDGPNTSAEESMAIYTAAIANKPLNILTVNDETHNTTASALVQFAINSLRTAKYKLVSVADCLGVAPYQSIGAPID